MIQNLNVVGRNRGRMRDRSELGRDSRVEAVEYDYNRDHPNHLEPRSRNHSLDSYARSVDAPMTVDFRL